MNWYALYTKSRCEKKVLQACEKNGIETYLPLRSTKKQYSDRLKTVEEIVLPSYIFVKLTKAQETEVRFIEGVVNFVYWQGKVAVIREKEINTLKQFLQTEGDVEVQFLSLEVGDEVELINGPLGRAKAIISRKFKNKIELILVQFNMKIIIDKKRMKNE
jgi:transcription antitermination factor NusG